MQRWRAQITRDRLREHEMWLIAGRPGPGALEHIEDVDFSGARFSGITFAYATIERCLFSDTAIVYATFDNAHLVECWSITANLSHCHFYDAFIERCRFPRTDFRSGKFPGVRIIASTFEASAFAHTGFVDAVVQDCSFRDSGFAKSQLDRSHFLNCDFRDTLLGGDCQTFDTHFENCDFRNANFEHLRFRDTTFTRCKFAGITGLAVIEGPVHVIEPDFSEAGDGSDVRGGEELLARWAKAATPGTP